MDYMNRVEGISKKYDGALEYGITMYDELPYQRNSDVCNASTLALYSGHVIKYYLCNNQMDSYTINNRDDQIEEILQRIRLEEEKRLQTPATQEFIQDASAEVTEEQIQSLLEDTGDSTEEDTTPAPEQTINLDDIEDW